MSELRTFAGFVTGLPAFLEWRITLAEARGVIAERMAARGPNLPASLERGMFGNPQNPRFSRHCLDTAVPGIGMNGQLQWSSRRLVLSLPEPMAPL